MYHLKNIEKWMISEKKDDSILSSLKEIIPEEEIKPVEKITEILRIYDLKDLALIINFIYRVLIILKNT